MKKQSDNTKQEVVFNVIAPILPCISFSSSKQHQGE